MSKIHEAWKDFQDKHPRTANGLVLGFFGGLLTGLVGALGTDDDGAFHLETRVPEVPHFRIVCSDSSNDGEPVKTSSVGDSWDDDWYRLQNLREQRNHEERMARIRAQYSKSSKEDEQ